MGLIDYISRHPVGKPQPPAYWDEHFVVALIDDFVKCVEFQDSSSNNFALNNDKTINYLGTKELNRNENFAHSNSVHTQTACTVRSQLFKSSRFPIKSNSVNPKIIQNPKMPYLHFVELHENLTAVFRPSLLFPL